MKHTRRRFLHQLGATAGALVVGDLLLGCGSTARACVLTANDIEGPYFRAGAPLTSQLVDPRTEGTRITLTGAVMDRRCQPRAGVTIEFWHADHEGRYDDVGFSFRAQVQTSEDGTYELATIIPGRYLNGSAYRPAHIHAKVHGSSTLTTQLYFPGDPHNDSDPWFGPDRLVSMDDDRARFDFVV